MSNAERFVIDKRGNGRWVDEERPANQGTIPTIVDVPCLELRSKDLDFPTLFLVARDSVFDRPAGEMGKVVACIPEIRLSVEHTVPPLMVFSDSLLRPETVHRIRLEVESCIREGRPMMLVEKGLTFYQFADGKWSKIHDAVSDDCPSKHH